MAKPRWVFQNFTAIEMRVIELRTHGIKTPDIGRLMGRRTSTVSMTLTRAMRKAGVDDVCLLTRWAIQHGLDEALPAEKPEDLPRPEPKVYKQRIRLQRIRRARTGQPQVHPNLPATRNPQEGRLPYRPEGLHKED